MTDQAQAAAIPAAPQAISMADAKARYTASKVAAAAETKPNDASEAARILGKQSAAARQARQAEANAQTQEPSDEEGEKQVVDDAAQAGATQDDTATDVQPNATETDAEGEPEEAQTIDLGDGVKVTVDEVRDGFMLKADHTRKTQALAKDRTEFETARTQRLSELDTHLNLIRQVIPQPKRLSAFIQEMGADQGAIAFEAQNEAFEKLAGVIRATDAAKAKAKTDAEVQRDNDLAESYNKEWSDQAKRDKAYTELSSHALQLGASMDELRGMTVPAWIMKALDGDKKYQALQANKGNVTKLIADKPKVVKPGAKVSSQSADQTNVQNGYAKLKSSGSVADAVALLRTLRGGKRG